MNANVILGLHDIAVARFVRSEQSQFEQVGFVFGAKIEIDGKTYQCARLPDSWTVVQVNDFQAQIYDDRGQNRASLSANVEDDTLNGSLYLHPRYWAGTYELVENDRTRVVGRARRYMMTGVETVFETAPVNMAGLKFPATVDSDLALYREVEQWLDSNYPDWRNPLAYWE